ncbi:VanZ family protein [Photobacterium minamisatsumaniensis]|uniref:VanZ family protein n=1 Tax=Photobacterium minamisatsumaniensis TaxID=2910233 RepID=UPI003D0C476D
MILRKYAHTAIIVFIIYICLITYLSLMPGADEGGITDLEQYGILFLDKILHLGAYCCFILLAHFIFVFHSHLFLFCAAISFYGIAIEVIQSLAVQGREGSCLDALSNILGVTLGYTIVLFYRRLSIVSIQ